MTPQTLNLSKRSGYEVGDNFGDFGALYECSLVQLLEKNIKNNASYHSINQPQTVLTTSANDSILNEALSPSHLNTQLYTRDSIKGKKSAKYLGYGCLSEAFFILEVENH